MASALGPGQATAGESQKYSGLKVEKASMFSSDLRLLSSRLPEYIES
jgi:hypothetical protein